MDLRRSCRLLLRPEDLPPSQPELEVVGAFNPGAADFEGGTALLVRVAERPIERRAGYLALPRWNERGGIVIDWEPAEAWQFADPRVVRHRADGRLRLTFVSHLRVLHCGADGVPRATGASLAPWEPWEEYGIEDPRIVRLTDRYYVTYVAVSRFGVATALASTRDFVTFDRHGIIFCPQNKDVVLFPQLIDGGYVALHRPQDQFTRPEIWLARSADLAGWGHHARLLGGVHPWESGRVGAGPPPVRVDDGWLAIYHANRRDEAGAVGAYVAGAVLLDARDPRRVLGRSPEPILRPLEAWERRGFVDDVVFPTGCIRRGDALHIYYGAADACTAVAEISCAAILATISRAARTDACHNGGA